MSMYAIGMGFEQGIADLLLHYGVKVELSPASYSNSPNLLIFDNGRADTYDIRAARRVPRLDTPPNKSVVYAFPSLAEQQRQQAVAQGINFYDELSRELFIAGRWFTDGERKSQSTPSRKKVVAGLLRIIARDGVFPRQLDAAAELGVTQQAVSKAVGILKKEHGISKQSWTMQLVLDAYVQLEDVQPRVTLHFEGASPAYRQVDALTSYLNELDATWAYAGLIAADNYAPWKFPDKVLILTDEILNLDNAGFFTAAPGSSLTVEIVGRTTALSQASEGENGSRYADPLTTWGTLRRSHDPDDQQALHKLEEWITQTRA